MKKLLIIDSNSIIHRAYHALPPLKTKSGELSNAVYGFLLAFFKAIKDFHPEYIAATFDYPAPNFRHKKYKEYKAKRPVTPEDLYTQIPKVKDILKAFDIPIFEKQGFEADDLIGTIAHLSSKKEGIEVIIVSGDKDVFQLINPNTKVYLLRKGVKDIVLYDEAAVKNKFQGLDSKQLLDYKALRGDPSDNIPGITGIGEKGAIELLLKFGNLDNLYKEIDDTKDIRLKLKELLLKYKEQGFLSRELAEIKIDVDVDFKLEECSWSGYDKDKAAKVLEKMEFFTLIERMPDISHQEETKKTKENLKLW